MIGRSKEIFQEYPGRVGVVGAIVGVIGRFQATEVLKEIMGAGDSLAGRLLIYDALGGRFQSVDVAWDANNPRSGTEPTITDLSVHAGPRAASFARVRGLVAARCSFGKNSRFQSITKLWGPFAACFSTHGWDLVTNALNYVNHRV